MTTCLFHKLLSVYVFSYFPFGFEGRIWDLIGSVSDHCLSFYFSEIHCVVKMNCNVFLCVNLGENICVFVKKIYVLLTL